MQFKKGQILKNEKRPNKSQISFKKFVKITNVNFRIKKKTFEICSNLSKTGLKIYHFCQHSKKAKEWPNGQTILFLANNIKKGQMATLVRISHSNLMQVTNLKIDS
jgi:hypothetical protein